MSTLSNTQLLEIYKIHSYVPSTNYEIENKTEDEDEKDSFNIANKECSNCKGQDLVSSSSNEVIKKIDNVCTKKQSRKNVLDMLISNSDGASENLKKICKALSSSYIGKKEYRHTSNNIPEERDKCNVCNKNTIILNDEFQTCYSCGNERKYRVEKHNLNMSTHNISSNTLMLFKIIGPDNHRYQKSLLQTSSDYKNYRRGYNIREFLILNRKVTNPLPKNILVKAAELFTSIQDAGNIVRADFKFGVWGAFIYFECVRAKITKKPKEIADFVGVTPKYLSKGQRAVRRWHEDGLIKIPIRSDPIPDFIGQYFEILDIDIKYKQFILDIIDRIEKKRINIYSSSNPSTQVVAIIWVLIDAFKLNITHATIVEKCDISKSTYISYFKLIISNEKKMRKTFVSNNIPLPQSWKQLRKKKKRIVRRKIIRKISKIPKNNLYQEQIYDDIGKYL